MNNLLNKTQEQLIKYSMKYYKIAHKRECNFSNPRLFTEKIQWYTFHYHNPLCPYIVDKITFKDYIESKLGKGYTISLIASWQSIEEFEKSWEQLPQRFCLKSNLSSDGRNIRVVLDKNAENFAEIREEVAKWFLPENTNINSLARNFYDRPPRVLAEEYMSNFEDQLYDYKFFCFDGKPMIMYVAIEHFKGERYETYPISFYDLDWNRLDVTYGHHARAREVPRPNHFEEMKSMAQKLSKDFPFVRVDFFDTGEKLYVAELTFNPGGGFIPYLPVEFDEYMGSLFNLPEQQS
ncbi:MAG: hypothetical protein J6T78_01375 [Bacteroidaceae bacterium]|nr:hypothetical protein [Bacteroidaceae bacterium]